MSNLFMNMQRRRWQQDSQQQPRSADANVSPKRSTRAATPGPITSAKTNEPHIKIYDLPYTNEIHTNGDKAYSYSHKDHSHSPTELDPLANILSLQLRKPKHWKWELSTSKSCNNIALPRILLYDHKGKLLVNTPPGGASSHEVVYKQEDFEQPVPVVKTKKRPYAHQRSATTNLPHSVRKALEKEFDGLQIQEVSSNEQSSRTTPPSASSIATTMRSRRSKKSIDFNTKDLSDISPRSSSARGVRFHVDKEFEEKIPDFMPTPPSTTTTPTTSSSSGPREKRKYRRSHSSGRSSSRSISILERFSIQKGRLSSPDTEDEQLVDNQTPSQYFLSTDEAGTLSVHRHSSSSSSNPRRRRKPHKHLASSDNLNQTAESHPEISQAATPTPIPTTQDSPNSTKSPSEASTTASNSESRRKLLPIRRHRTDGDILANKNLSATEDEQPVLEDIEIKEKTNFFPPSETLAPSCTCRKQCRYTRNETRDLNSSIPPVELQRNGKIR